MEMRDQHFISIFLVSVKHSVKYILVSNHSIRYSLDKSNSKIGH